VDEKDAIEVTLGEIVAFGNTVGVSEAIWDIECDNVAENEALGDVEVRMKPRLQMRLRLSVIQNYPSNELKKTRILKNLQIIS